MSRYLVGIWKASRLNGGASWVPSTTNSRTVVTLDSSATLESGYDILDLLYTLAVGSEGLRGGYEAHRVGDVDADEAAVDRSRPGSSSPRTTRRS